MGKPVAFFEVLSPDQERAQKFYAELFGWKVQADPEMGGYALVDTDAGEGAVGGGIGAAESAADTGTTIYVRVDDLDGYLARAQELGGTTVLPPMELPGGFGRIAAFTDPDGTRVGLWA